MDPLHQFVIVPWVPIEIGDVNLSFTNSAFAMVLAVILVYGFVMLGMRNAAIVPHRLQSVVELYYEFVVKMVRDNAGPEARPFVPFIFTLFSFILFGNLIGMVPITFTFTSHIVVSFTLAVTVLVFVTILGLVKHGLHFFTLFLPHGAPLWLSPLMVPLEMVSYLFRPISLSVRLFANMMAGHTMLKVFAGLAVMLVTYQGEQLGTAAAIGPVLINIALTGLELLVSCLQAFVFTLLSCMYIKDALELH